MDAVPLAPIVRVYAFDELHMVILYRVNVQSFGTHSSRVIPNSVEVCCFSCFHAANC